MNAKDREIALKAIRAKMREAHKDIKAMHEVVNNRRQEFYDFDNDARWAADELRHAQLEVEKALRLLMGASEYSRDIETSLELDKVLNAHHISHQRLIAQAMSEARTS